MKGFWRFIETRVSRHAVLAEWQHVAGRHFAAIRPLLSPTDQATETYPALGTMMHLPRVVDYGDGTVAAVCSRDPERRMYLSPSDIVLYALDLHALRKLLCSLLPGLAIAKTSIEPAAMVVHVGNWEPKKAAAFPVFLLLCRTRSSLRAHVTELASTLAKPGAIVLTPTRATWDDNIEALARSKRLLLVAIDEVIEVVADMAICAAGWDEYLSAFCQMVGTTLPANFKNKKKPARRSQRAANIEKLEKTIGDHLLSAKNHAYSLGDQGREIVLLPRPEQQFLAAQLGMTTTTVSRCLNDPKAKMLRMLWETAESQDAVLKFRG